MRGNVHLRVIHPCPVISTRPILRVGRSSFCAGLKHHRISQRLFSRAKEEKRKKTILQAWTSQRATFLHLLIGRKKGMGERNLCYLGRSAAPRPVLGPAVSRRQGLRGGGVGSRRRRGRGRGGSLVLYGLGLRVPEVEKTGVAVDERPPRLGQRRIRVRVARALGGRRRRRRHPEPPLFSRKPAPHRKQAAISDQKRGKRAARQDAMRARRESEPGSERGRTRAIGAVKCGPRRRWRRRGDGVFSSPTEPFAAVPSAPVGMIKKGRRRSGGAEDESPSQCVCV